MGIAVKRGDVVQLNTWAVGGQTVRANLSLRPDSWWMRIFMCLKKTMFGGSDPFNITLDIVANSDRTLARIFGEITEDGEIDTVEITTIAGAAPLGPGELYSNVQVNRSDVNSSFLVIAAGYIHGGFAPSFPGRIDGPFDGPGRMNKQSLGDPAAGADYTTLAVPSAARTKLRGFFGQLVTGAGVANREFAVKITDTINNVGGSVATEIQTASLTDDYYGSNPPLSSGVSVALGGGAIGIGLPEMWLLPGWIVAPTTYNIQAADNWGPGIIMWEEWIDP